MSEEKLGPDDPTPDPESDPVDVVTDPKKGTTFVDLDKVKEAAKEAAGKIDLSDGVQPEEIVDAALEAATKVTPLSHHVVSELRKALVPIVTAIISFLAAGGFADWRATQAKEDAVIEAGARTEERRKAIEGLKLEIRKSLIENSSWDEVGRRLSTPSADEVVAGLLATGAIGTDEPPPAPAGDTHAAPFEPRYTPRTEAKIPLDLAKDLVNQEIQQIKLVPNELRAAPR